MKEPRVDLVDLNNKRGGTSYLLQSVFSQGPEMPLSAWQQKNLSEKMKCLVKNHVDKYYLPNKFLSGR